MGTTRGRMNFRGTRKGTTPGRKNFRGTRMGTTHCQMGFRGVSFLRFRRFLRTLPCLLLQPELTECKDNDEHDLDRLRLCLTRSEWSSRPPIRVREFTLCLIWRGDLLLAVGRVFEGTPKGTTCVFPRLWGTPRGTTRAFLRFRGTPRGTTRVFLRPLGHPEGHNPYIPAL
jgi:hypothetical protein